MFRFLTFWNGNSVFGRVGVRLGGVPVILSLSTAGALELPVSSPLSLMHDLVPRN